MKARTSAHYGLTILLRPSVGMTLWPLTIGNHVVEIACREDGIKLDKLLLTNDLAFVPTRTGN